MRPLVSIIVPVYNEAPVLRRVLRALDRLRLSKEVIAVDDGSTDGSGEILRSWPRGSFRLLRHPANRGKGSAVRTGLRAARGRFTTVQDADLETDPRDIIRLVRPLLRRPGSAAFGTRFRQPGSRRPGFRRFSPSGITGLANRFLTSATNILFGSRLTDMTCAYKAASTRLLRSLKLTAPRFEIEAELTGRLLNRGVAITEVPVTYRPRTYRQGKKIHPGDGIRILLTLLRVRAESRPSLR